MKSRISGRHAVACALILVLGIPAVAVGFGEGRSLIAGKRSPSTGALSSETEIIADNGAYGTRQSNKRDGDGGGAIYGCRANAGAEPCVRANNLKSGRAFEFETRGSEAGKIQVGDGTGAPFSTNATGRVENLNADRLDGRDSTELASAGDLLFAVVAADGTLGNQRGGVSATRQAGTNTYIVTFNRDVSRCSYGATAAGGDNADKPSPSVTGGTVTTNVRVDFGAAAGPTAFHLQVIC